jgi:hypothetical protein
MNFSDNYEIFSILCTLYGDSCNLCFYLWRAIFWSRLFKSTALELTNWRMNNLEKRWIHRRAYLKIKSQFDDMERGICLSWDLQWQLCVFCLEVSVFLWEVTDAIFAKKDVLSYDRSATSVANNQEGCMKKAPY